VFLAIAVDNLADAQSLSDVEKEVEDEEKKPKGNGSQSGNENQEVRT
jgi:hypothetical protein